MGGGVTERIGRRRLIGAIGIDMQRYLSYRFSWWWGCRIGWRFSLVTVPLVSGLGGFGFVSLWLWWPLPLRSFGDLVAFGSGSFFGLGGLWLLEALGLVAFGSGSFLL